MIKIDIFPFKSVLGVDLNSTKRQVRRAVGKPSRKIDNIYHYQKEDPMFSVDFDAEGLVEYISISKPITTEVQVLFKGLNVFDIPALDLVNNIESELQYKFDPDDPELGYSFVFPEIQLSLWRSVISEDETDQEGKYFQTVGIGVEGYYNKGFQ